MEYTAKFKDSWGAWTYAKIQVLTVDAPRNVRGRVTGSNWAVDFTVPTLFGNPTRTKYFPNKTDAAQWIAQLLTTN